MPLHVSSTMCSSSGGQKLYYTVSGIITPIGGRPVYKKEICYVVCLWQCSVRAESVHTPWSAIGLGPCLVLRCCIFLPVVRAECVMSHLYSFSDKLYPTWRWPQHHWSKHIVGNLYKPDNIVVLWLLYHYRIITLGSNKHNWDDAPWSLNEATYPNLT